MIGRTESIANRGEVADELKEALATGKTVIQAMSGKNGGADSIKQYYIIDESGETTAFEFSPAYVAQALISRRMSLEGVRRGLLGRFRECEAADVQPSDRLVFDFMDAPAGKLSASSKVEQNSAQLGGLNIDFLPNEGFVVADNPAD
ncbi:MAG: hypothetical protein AAB462_02905 [Patescibacteria group bacterium]